MRPQRHPLLVCVIAMSLCAAGATAWGQAPPSRPRTPTAHCSDGTYYYGPRNRRLACAHHRGVAEWLAASSRPSSSRHVGAAARRRAASVPRGATARCRDGTYSFVRNRGRACAEHRGIARWLRADGAARPN
jgi:hypothetical protein